MKRRIQLVLVSVAVALLLGAFGAGVVSAKEDFYCYKTMETTCVTNYCTIWMTPGWDCRYQPTYDDCECIPVAQPDQE